MIKKSNTRVIITLSKKQLEWIDETRKQLEMTRSKLIKWLMNKNLSHIISALPSQQIEYIYKIAKTNWVNLEDEEGDEIDYER